MDKPTEKQIKEFWEWCGFKSRLVWSDPFDIGGHHQFTVWDYPDRSGVTQHLAVNPPIDLNNLFKYTVPIVHNKLGDEDCYNLMIRWIRDVIFGKDPALALFWALWQTKPPKEKPPFSVGCGGDS